MLHKETVESSTLELLKQLQAESLLQTFNLVGGTALALRLGHRKSIDLDLLMPIKALTYFDEIDFNESVIMTTTQFDWNHYAKRLNDMVRNCDKVFVDKP